jgi:hypothetical protein
VAHTPANQQQYPQPRTQAAGVGFPIARIVIIFSLAIGVAIDATIGPYQGKQTGENNLFRNLLECFLPGEIALADRYYASCGISRSCLTAGSIGSLVRITTKDRLSYGSEVGALRSGGHLFQTQSASRLDGLDHLGTIAGFHPDSPSSILGRPIRLSRARDHLGNDAGQRPGVHSR